LNNFDAVTDNSTAEVLRELQIRAAESGLNLFRVLTQRELETAGLAWPVDKPGLLLLFGNGGGELWRHFAGKASRGEIPDSGFSDESADQLVAQCKDHPIDRASMQLVDDLVKSSPLLAAADCEVLYPQSDKMLPLQQLGAIAGWHNASPLGTGIHPEWGLWFAYRVLLWLELPIRTEALSPSSMPPQQLSHSDSQGLAGGSSLISDICITCQSRACVSACPGEAIEFATSPNMDACARYRLSDQSICGDRCKSREACPAGRADRQYSRAQINYHYRVALKGLANYYGDPSADESKP